MFALSTLIRSYNMFNGGYNNGVGSGGSSTQLWLKTTNNQPAVFL